MWPSSGFHPKVWWCRFTGLVWICHDGEISASVMFVICYFLFLRGTGGGICDVRYPGVRSSFIDIVVLLTDTHTYYLYTHNGDGSI